MKEPRSVLKRSEESYSLYKGLLASLRVGTAAYLQAGRCLWHLRQGNKFKDILGDPMGEWRDFLGQPEVSLPYSTANKLLKAYEVFKEWLKVPDDKLDKIPWHKLKAIAPHITEENKEELLAIAESGSIGDLAKSITEITSGVTIGDCKHGPYKERKYWECLTCKERFYREPK